MINSIRNVISPCLALGSSNKHAHGIHSMPMLQMSNGVDMPAVGLGTFQVFNFLVTQIKFIFRSLIKNLWTLLFIVPLMPDIA